MTSFPTVVSNIGLGSISRFTVHWWGNLVLKWRHDWWNLLVNWDRIIPSWSQICWKQHILIMYDIMTISKTFYIIHHFLFEKKLSGYDVEICSSTQVTSQLLRAFSGALPGQKPGKAEGGQKRSQDEIWRSLNFFDTKLSITNYQYITIT